MQTTNTIEEQLTRKAHNELRKKIEKAAETLFEWPYVCVDIKGEKIQVRFLLKSISDAIFEENKNAAAKRCIEEFLNEFEILKANMESLEDSVNEINNR